MSRKIPLKGYRLKNGKLIKSSKGLSVSQKIAQRKSKKIRVVKAGIVGLACVLALPADARPVKVCNVFDHCWIEDDGKPAPRRHHKKRHRKPEVRAYVKREDDDGVRCKDMLTVIGDARPSEQGAREDAEAVFMRATRFRYGESWMTIENARDYAVRCSRASITEIVGNVMIRCEIKARPCRPPFQSK